MHGGALTQGKGKRKVMGDPYGTAFQAKSLTGGIGFAVDTAVTAECECPGAALFLLVWLLGVSNLELGVLFPPLALPELLLAAVGTA